MVIFRCHWDENRICTGNMKCRACEFQPEDSQKKNYGNPPMKPTKYTYGMPKCPACGELPHSNERCVFCGQELDLSDTPQPEITVDGGHYDSNDNLTCDKCGTKTVRLVAMGDGFDYDTWEMINTCTFNCENNHVITIKKRSRDYCGGVEEGIDGFGEDINRTAESCI